MMSEAAHTMRVPRGTRGPACTSPCRLNEASPTLTMMDSEELPPARMVTGGAGSASPWENVEALCGQVTDIDLSRMPQRRGGTAFKLIIVSVYRQKAISA